MRILHYIPAGWKEFESILKYLPNDQYNKIEMTSMLQKNY